MKLHTTSTMRIVCPIFDYSSYLPIGIRAQSTWGITRQAIFWFPKNCFQKIHACKINKMPEFYTQKVFFPDFIWRGMPRFLRLGPLCIFLVLLAWFKLHENFAHVTVAGFVQWLAWTEFRTLLDDVTLAIS